MLKITQMLRTIISFSVAICLVFTACKSDTTIESKDSTTPNPETAQTAEQAQAPASEATTSAASDGKIAAFITDNDGTKIWKSQIGSMSYHFLPEGKIEVLLKRGKRDKWEGSWKIAGNKLIIDVPDFGNTVENKIEIDGENILLESVPYSIVRPGAK